MGDSDSETLSNVTMTQWDFEDEAFDEISACAKDFISKLLVKRLEYVVHRHTHVYDMNEDFATLHLLW